MHFFIKPSRNQFIIESLSKSRHPEENADRSLTQLQQLCRTKQITTAVVFNHSATLQWHDQHYRLSLSLSLDNFCKISTNHKKIFQTNPRSLLFLLVQCKQNNKIPLQRGIVTVRTLQNARDAEGGREGCGCERAGSAGQQYAERAMTSIGVVDRNSVSTSVTCAAS